MAKAFIFDMDGVIINSEPMHEEIELAVAAEQGVIVASEKLKDYVGVRSRDMWEHIIAEHHFSVDVDKILTEAVKRKIQYIEATNISPIDGIKELLDQLTLLKYQIGLASSSPKPFIEAVLSKFGMKKYFHIIVSGDEIKKGKPAPDIYLEAAQRLKVTPNNCIVLEDSENGVKSANRAGMKTIGYYNPESGNLNLSHANITVVSIKEVLRLI